MNQGHPQVVPPDGLSQMMEGGLLWLKGENVVCEALPREEGSVAAEEGAHVHIVAPDAHLADVLQQSPLVENPGEQKPADVVPLDDFDGVVPVVAFHCREHAMSSLTQALSRVSDSSSSTL